MSGAARRGSAGRLTRFLVWFHRWLGIATCLIFALWFASGAVLLFQPFPSLPTSAQMAMAAPVDMPSVRVTPAEALAISGNAPQALTLLQRADRPAYAVETASGLVLVDARTGDLLPLMTHDQARAVLRRALGKDPADLSGPFDYDQWIVHNKFDLLRPFYRADHEDAAGTQSYVSARTGEIVQQTTIRERGWNWIGAVLHWVYFTPLRTSFTAWDQSVWWLSLVTMLVAVAGIVLGIMRTMTVRRAKRPGLTYFRLRWMRWHHLFGLGSAVFVLTWIVSGWLSMDHGRLFSRGQASAEQERRYAGMTLDAAAGKVTPAWLRTLPPARQIGSLAVGGVPMVALSHADGSTALHRESNRPLTLAERDGQIVQALRATWPGETVRAGFTVPPTALYGLAEGMPASARRYDIGDSGDLSVYVDGDRGRILTVMDNSRAAYAWIYYALHTFKFPGLIEQPILRQILALALLIPGFLFSITGVVIGWKRLRKTI